MNFYRAWKPEWGWSTIWVFSGPGNFNFPDSSSRSEPLCPHAWPAAFASRRPQVSSADWSLWPGLFVPGAGQGLCLQVKERDRRNPNGLSHLILPSSITRGHRFGERGTENLTEPSPTVRVSLSSLSGLTFTATVVIIPTISGGGTVFSGIPWGFSK